MWNKRIIYCHPDWWQEVLCDNQHVLWHQVEWDQTEYWGKNNHRNPTIFSCSEPRVCRPLLPPGHGFPGLPRQSAGLGAQYLYIQPGHLHTARLPWCEHPGIPSNGDTLLQKLAGLWVAEGQELFYNQLAHITFMCPMRFNKFPFDRFRLNFNELL